MCGMGLAQGCKPDAGAGMQMPPPLVTTAVAISQDVSVYLDEIGRCSALESVTIRPQVAGRIVERHFEDGQELKKGSFCSRSTSGRSKRRSIRPMRSFPRPGRR